MELKKVINPKNQLFEDRKTVRKYDPTVKISREEMENILQDAMTAPSSFNLQPWRFIVIDSEEVKEQIRPFLMFNQVQGETASAIIAVYADLEIEENVNKILTANVEHKLADPDRKEYMTQKIKNYKASQTEMMLKNGIMLDAGFVIMQLMLSAKAYGYDTNAIGGYDKVGLSEALNIDTNRYLPVLLISIGKGVEEGHDTLRMSVNEVTQWR